MKLLTQYKAAKIEGAPSVNYLNKVSKKDNRPEYFVWADDKWKIDIESDAWKNMIAERENKKSKGNQSGKRTDLEMQELYESQDITTDTASTDEELSELVEKSRKAKILEPILKAELQQHKIEMNKLEMQREAGALIEYQLAEFLFLGYLEKLNLENLKLFDKLEPMIKNLCKENKPKELINLLKREQENILVEIKRAQKEDVRKWKEEK